ESGTFKKTLVASTAVTTETVLAGTFNSKDLSAQSGEGVEVRVIGLAEGVGSDAATVEVGAIEWNASHDRVAQVLSPPRVSSAPRVFAPTLLPGEVVVSVPRVASPPRVIEPAFVGSLDPDQVIPPAVRSTPRVFSPTVTTGPVTINVPRVDGPRNVFGVIVTLETVVRSRRAFVVRRTLEGYAGPIRMQNRLFLSDSTGSELAPLPEWEEASVTMSNYADATWTLDLKARHTDAFDPLRDHILAAIDVMVAGTWERFYMGLYRFVVPSYSYLEHLRTWTLTGRSLEEVLRQDEPSEGYTAAAGTGALAAAKTIILGGGIPAGMIRFPVADKPLPHGLYFDPLDESGATSRLGIVNEILNAGGFEALKADRHGRFYAREMNEDSKRAPDVFYGPHNVPDAENFVGEEVSDDWDDERFANRIVVTSDDVNQDPPLVAVAENRNPDSRGSYERMGRWITKRVNLKTITSQVDADRMARAQLEAASGFYRRATINTLRDPRREPDETYEMAVDSEGVRVMDGRWRVINWSLSMSGGLEPMQHEIAKVEKL
ncbi:MAG: hypothetical protein M3R38_05955, partial [Actinomycetota bacterium]|nr:hypothetical protein [Actinomycetota bacterium]